MKDLLNKFGVSESLVEAIKKIQAEETEYQMKVKALMKKKGITSLGQLSPDEKKAFFSQLDTMHKAKHEEVELEEGYEKVILDFLDKKGFDSPHFKNGDLYVSKSEFAGVKKALKNPTGFNASDLKVIAEEIELKEMDKSQPSSSRGAEGVPTGKKADPIKTDKLKQDALKTLYKSYKDKKVKEDVELDEGKSGTGYELYHKDFSSAMQHAYDFAKKKYNIEIDPFEIDRNVAMGPKKPSSGKANAYRLLDKTGKKAIQVQVTNLDNQRYELNMYKEEVEEERDLPFTPDKPKKNPGVVPGKHGVGPSVAKHLAKLGMKKQQEKKPMKEEEELTESHFKVGDSVECIASGMKGEVVKLDEPQTGKYYTVKREDGKMIKYAPDELKKVSEMKEADEGASKKKETEFHSKLDKLVHKTFGKRPEEKKEAASPAQQAAIAISMKKAGKKPKDMKEAEGSGTSINTQAKRAAISMQMANLKAKQAKEREALMKKKQALSDEVEFQFDESFTPQMLDTLRTQYSTVNAIDPASDGYKKLIKMLDGLSDQNLKSLSKAKIKFVSGLAQNRVMRRGIKEEQIDEYDSKGGVYRHKGTYGSEKGAEYGDTDYGKENEMQKKLDTIKKAVKKGANQNRRTNTKLYKEEESATKDKDQIKNSKKQVVKKGDTLSGKKEPVIIEPEIKDK